MGCSRHNPSGRNRPLAAFALALALCVTAGAAQERAQENISLDAASTDLNYRTNTILFRDIVISQGDTTVRAARAEATGLDFENSRWTFEGDVRISVEQRGSLHSDRAVVDFRNNRIAEATITGSPAEFEQRRIETDQLARGRAGEIVYQVDEGTVRLSEDAWLTDGRNEIRGPELVYNIRQERVQAVTQPGEKERVRITIVPRDQDEQTEPR